MPTSAIAGRLAQVYELAGSTLASDTCTDTTGTLFSAHAPDSGFGGWNVNGTVSGGLMAISSNRLWVPYGYAGGNNAGILAAHSTSDVADDAFSAYLDYTRNTIASNTSNRCGLYVLVHATGGGQGNREGVRILFEGIAADNSIVTLILERITSAGGIGQSSTLNAAFALGLGGQIRLGATVDGDDVTVWTQPYGGGTETTQGTVTLNVDLQDGNHKRVGCYARWSFGTGAVDAGHFFDTFAVTAGTTAIGELRDFRLFAHQEVLETSSTDFRLVIPGERSWGASVRAFHLGADLGQSDIRDALLTPAELAFTFYPSTSSTQYVWTGNGRIADFGIGGPVHDAMLTDLVIDGSGALTEGS